MPQSILYLLIFALLAPAAKEKSAPGSEAELNNVEQVFVGKWRGSRTGYEWEIERFPDRTFEIAMTEVFDGKKYRNWGRGTWRVEGDNYFCDWDTWTGDEGDLGEEFSERIKTYSPEKIITLTEGDDADPNNIEIKVTEFKMPEWDLKPSE
ncbi:hypothetical protein [Cerasicoccus fimbriatus]|uniref:hypothetical protein n=1 Tax=Cerasicoccus fimbriatus TaxID=3014554 RepID=UPI0022B55F64|nr:hypothetical protein [Cerasicoccus sp. TK19100]